MVVSFALGDFRYSKIHLSKIFSILIFCLISIKSSSCMNLIKNSFTKKFKFVQKF